MQSTKIKSENTGSQETNSASTGQSYSEYVITIELKKNMFEDRIRKNDSWKVSGHENNKWLYSQIL